MRVTPKILIALALVLVAHPADARPVSSNFGSSVSEQAYADFLVFTKGGSKATANVTFIVDPQLQSMYTSQIKRDTLASVRMWSNDRAPSIKMDVYAAPTQHFQFIYDYMKQVISPAQLSSGWLDEKLRRSKTESSGFYGGGAPGNSINGDEVFMAYVPNKYPINDAHWNSLVSHEYVHVVQRSLFHGSMAPMQCWVREGQANYIGWSYSGRSSVSSFASAWKAQIRDLEQAHIYSKTQKFSKVYWQQWFLKTSFKMSPRIANLPTITLLAHSPFNTSMALTATQRSNRSCVISAMQCNHAVTVGLRSSPHASLLETQRSQRHSVFRCTAHTQNLLSTS